MAILLGDLVNEGFLHENVSPFCQAAKKSGCNDEVTILLEVAVRQGFTVV